MKLTPEPGHEQEPSSVCEAAALKVARLESYFENHPVLFITKEGKAPVAWSAQTRRAHKEVWIIWVSAR